VPTTTRANLIEARCDEAVGDGIGVEESIKIGQVPELQGPHKAVALS
jgi:hypothetical protein